MSGQPVPWVCLHSLQPDQHVKYLLGHRPQLSAFLKTLTLGTCSTAISPRARISNGFKMDADMGNGDRALVAGLASVQDSELPLLCSNFWSRHILQGRPAGVLLRCSCPSLFRVL